MKKFEKKIDLFSLKSKKKIETIIFIEEEKSQIKFSIKNDLLNIDVVDEYPFFSLVKLRQGLELEGYYILVYGSLYNIYPSGMQYETYNAYELELGKPATKTVDILDRVEYSENISSVKDQKLFFKRWIESLGNG